MGLEPAAGGVGTVACAKGEEPSHRARASLSSKLPGLFLTALIAGLAFALRQVPGIAVFSPMIIAILIGMAFHNLVGTPARARPGVIVSMRTLLRFAIILLGLQLTVLQVVAVGASGVAMIATTLVATFAFTVWLGGLIGVDRKLAELIAAGTSICGASAVVATNTVTRAHDEDVAYAVACVTIFGSIAMFLYPLLPASLGLDAHGFGFWAGASIHEIAQVVAAAFQDGKDAGELATIVKLSRVVMLAPMVIAIGLVAGRRGRRAGNAGHTGRAPVPWFVLGFVALVGVNSLIVIPDDQRQWIATATTFLLSMALAAMGLETDVRKLWAKGVRPLILGLSASLFIAGFSLVLIKMAT